MGAAAPLPAHPPPLSPHPALAQSIFELLNSVYGELEDPAAPHFRLCLSILETVAQARLPPWPACAVLRLPWRLLGGAPARLGGWACSGMVPRRSHAGGGGPRAAASRPLPCACCHVAPTDPIPCLAAGLQVKCSLLVLDLPRAEELTCQLFSTLLDAVK